MEFLTLTYTFIPYFGTEFKMPTPDKILMRKIKKREKKKLQLIAEKANVTANGKGNLFYIALFLSVAAFNTCVEYTVNYLFDFRCRLFNKRSGEKTTR